MVPTTSNRVRLSNTVFIDGNAAIVTDMDLAVYLYMVRQQRGLEVARVQRLGSGKHEFFFTSTDDGTIEDKITQLELAFANSPEAANFAAAQRALKRLMREQTGGYGHARARQRRAE